MCEKMIKSTLLTAVILMLLGSDATAQSSGLKSHPATDAYDGWRLGVQAWTFKKFTFYEAIEKTASLGLNWIEAYPGQKLNKEYPSVKINPDMPAELRSELKQKLKDSGIKLINFGVVELPNDEAKCRKVFDFAKDMGIETIVSEPPVEAFDLVEKLCKEYKIKVAIHNHPKPSFYWDPDKILELCKGRSKLIGACADTGHWVRSGLDPVESLKKLEGRIISLHLKEIGDGHDIAWGTGINHVEPILRELHRQNFKGVFSVEYEYNWENSVPEIRKSAQFFNKTSGSLNPTGWRDLLAEGLNGWILKPGTWTIDDGVLTLKGGGYLWTKETYGDFILDLEFMVSKEANSGVFFRTADIKNLVQTGIEVQIHETNDENHYGMCGAIYNCMPPKKNMMKKAGLWNRMTLMAKANKIYVVMNGEQIIDMDLDLWTTPHRNPDGTKNKFDTAYRDMPRNGHIGFQDHGDSVWFRNIKIKPLKD
jgi:sugar phosphate isomerase/epimerase